MRYQNKPLSYEKQLDLFIERGIIVENRENAIKKIANIGYYKLKEFIVPFEEKTEEGIKYKNVSFNDVTERFYNDKNIRFAILHAIEKIELSFKNKFAYVLGERFGGHYLKFNYWCNKDEYCKHYLELKQNEFKKELEKSIEMSKNKVIKEFNSCEENKGGFPPIWMIVNILGFGTILYLYGLMSNKKKEIIAKQYKCSLKEFNQWIKTIKFVRNKCAHNINLIDLQIAKTPIIKDEWKEILYSYEKEEQRFYSDRIALSFVIIKHFIDQINQDYDCNNLYKTLDEFIKGNDEIAHSIGFKNAEAIKFLIGEYND